MAATPRQAEPRDLHKTADAADQSHSDGRMTAMLTDAVRADGTLVLSRDQQLQILTALKNAAGELLAKAAEKKLAAESISLHNTLDQSCVSLPVAFTDLCAEATRLLSQATAGIDLAELLYDAKEIRVTLSPSQLASSAGGGQ